MDRPDEPSDLMRCPMEPGQFPLVIFLELDDRLDIL